MPTAPTAWHVAFRRWLASSSTQEVADALEITPSYVARLARGAQLPSLTLATKIATLTLGRVALTGLAKPATSDVPPLPRGRPRRVKPR